jgi:hypothetical protein
MASSTRRVRSAERAVGRRLQHGGQHGGFAEGEARGRLVEIALGRRLDPIGAGPEIDPAQIEGEDLPLGVLLLQLHRQHQLLGLALHGAVGVEEQVPRQLLGDGRGAFLGAAIAQIGDDGPRDPQGVEPRVRIEPSVLDGDEGGGHIGRQPGEIRGRGEPSAPDAQHGARAVHIGHLRVPPDLRQARHLGGGAQQGKGGELADQG